MRLRIAPRHPARLGSLVLLAAGVLALALAATGSAATGSSPRLHPRVVTTWPSTPLGLFAESMALGRDGRLYASVTAWGETADVGRVVTVSPKTGHRTPFGPPLDVAGGLLTGVAFDEHGRLYVAEATFSADVPPAIVRVGRDGTVTTIAMLPADSFPNGLAIRGRFVYVSDSALGAIWRAPLAGHALALTTPWLAAARLAPTHDIGANGIAFRGHRLWIAVSDTGAILRVSVRHDGSPGVLRTVIRRPRLVTVDGIAFDRRGRPWVTTNGPATGRLLRLTAPGRLDVIADRPSWCDYPTQPVLGGHVTAGTVFVENGSFDNGTPSIVALHSGATGVLP